MIKKKIAFIGIVLIAILFISGCATIEQVKDCDYYCSQEGQGPAISPDCVQFTECDDPGIPVTAEICEGVELCCCES
ncbi:MAG: hypothetical protein JW716_05015 [Candidatus Aenigmarchaeota archaeon]|nr:hypothetical protein [Candidatus Aenigmarchaeota archaeon]